MDGGARELGLGQAQRSDVVEVTYDDLLGYPAYIRGIGKLGLPDNWFWVRASQLRF